MKYEGVWETTYTLPNHTTAPIVLIISMIPDPKPEDRSDYEGDIRFYDSTASKDFRLQGNVIIDNGEFISTFKDGQVTKQIRANLSGDGNKLQATIDGQGYEFTRKP